ncbi:hypothetical protein K7432_007982, partial [Basidiobolus ranarum]
MYQSQALRRPFYLVPQTIECGSISDSKESYRDLRNRRDSIDVELNPDGLLQ